MAWISVVAGQDATEIFFSLHRYEVLQKPQYKRLQIGTIAGQEQQIFPRAVGTLSKVPYAEPTWLSPGYHSPYYKDVCHGMIFYAGRSSRCYRVIGACK